MAPPEKKQKTCEEEKTEEVKAAAEEEADETPKIRIVEPPKEHETDAPACTKPKNKEPVTFLTPDTTLNVMRSEKSNILMSLKDGGIKHLYAGARASVGFAKGRYMFEVKVLESMSSPDASNNTGNRGVALKTSVRVGFSTAGSSLILGSGEEGVGFESDGSMFHDKKRMAVGTKFGRDSVVAVLLNLDKESPNFNTISLFKDGRRACPPQPLGESLKGKTLFPHVSFKHATLHANFGPSPHCPLPFKCRMVQDAVKVDTTVTKYDGPTDGKYSVVFPASLPDEGTFDWLDMFLEKNRSYMELSDRMILSWAEQSGIWRTKGYAAKTCNDKPDMSFQVAELDDNSIRKSVYAIAPLQARNFVVMEVKGNLMEDERKEFLAHFPTSVFKRTAWIVVGDPTAEFKKRSQQLMLKQKQESADKAFVLQRLEEKRKKMIAKRQKELEQARKKAEKEAEKERKHQECEAKKKAAEEKKDGEDNEGDQEKKQEEEGKVAEEEEEEKEEEEEAEKEKEDEEKEETPPKVELTDEEKKLAFRKHDVTDLMPSVLNSLFTKFTLPSKAEGFDDIKYEWAKSTKAEEHVKRWILERKLSMPVEDLQASTWFNQQWAKFQQTTKSWHMKVGEYKALLARKAAEKTAKEAMKKAAAERKAAEKKAKEEAKKAAEEAKKAAEEAAKAAQEQKEGEEKKDEDAEGKKKDGEEEKKDGEEEKKDGEEEKKDEDVKAMEVDKEGEKEEDEDDKDEEEKEEEQEDIVDFDAIDVFGAEDILNVGANTPLFKDFEFEDWVMLSLRFELHLLVHSFRKDVDDPDRTGIRLDHLAYYYSRYFKETLSPKDYGVETFKGIVDLVNDSVRVTEDSLLQSKLDSEMETLSVFAKLTEEARRHRGLCLALGEDDAKLKLSGVAVQGQRSQHAPRKPYQGQRHHKGFQQQGYGKAGQKGHHSKGGHGFAPYGAGGAGINGGKAGGKGHFKGVQQPVVAAPFAARMVAPHGRPQMVHAS